LSASPPEHPLTVTVRGTERIEALLQLDTQGPSRGHVVDSQPTLSRLITKELQSSSILYQVESPHMSAGWRPKMDTHETRIQTVYKTLRTSKPSHEGCLTHDQMDLSKPYCCSSILGNRTRDLQHGAAADASRGLASSGQNTGERQSTCHSSTGGGGSRGNPGPGGSAVAIRTADATVHAQVCWIGTMSYANPRFTNNIREHLGLFCGLKACDKHTFEPLHVIGAKHFQNYYWQSRKLADRLDVVAWHHHLREFNKMADTLANMAMDNTSSTQGLLSEDTAATVRWAKTQWCTANGRQRTESGAERTVRNLRRRAEDEFCGEERGAINSCGDGGPSAQ
ncbi:Reverse transcriptase-like, partial [Phytophthora infestans]